MSDIKDCFADMFFDMQPEITTTLQFPDDDIDNGMGLVPICEIKKERGW
jgi:hypothetical protein